MENKPRARSKAGRKRRSSSYYRMLGIVIGAGIGAAVGVGAGELPACIAMGVIIGIPLGHHMDKD